MTVLSDASMAPPAASPSGPVGTVDPVAMPLERVEAELCTLAGQIAAATSRFLTLLADFDAREGWGGWGVHSCAHWLSWRCGLDLRTAQEHVRVARALRELPQTSAAFGQGWVSYSKVRAISRIGTADNEHDLVEAALHAPASQLERLLRGIRTAKRNNDEEDRRRGNRGNAGRESQDGARGTDDPDAGGEPDASRYGVQWRWDDDGSLKLWGRLRIEDGARLLAGLTRMDQQRRRTDPGTEPGPEQSTACGQARSAERSATGDAAACCGHARSAERSGSQSQPHPASPGTVRSLHHGVAGVAPADLGPALVAGAELMCTSVQAPVFAPAADVIVHVDADTLTETACRAAGEAAATAATASQAATADPAGVFAQPRLDDGPALLHTTVQRLACSGRIQLSVDGPDGRTLDLGRRRRFPTKRLLQALWRRDRGCTHPGCGRTRFLHAHHVSAWAAGGHTDLDNLIQLCGQHHRALHDAEFAIVALGKQKFRFHGPHGAVRPQAPPMTGDADALVAAHADIGPTTIEPDWDGSPLDPPHAVNVYLHRWAVAERRRTAAEAAADATS